MVNIVDMIHYGYATVQESPMIRLHYAEIQGAPNAPLMLFLHGFPEYWYAWSDYLPTFARLGFHVVAPDLRGFHKSDRPISVKDYDMKFLVNDIKNLIRSFGKEKAIIVGHDWGGSITWELADQYPEVCEKIIVLNSPHRGAYAKNIRKSIGVNFKQSLRSWYIYFFQLPVLPEFALKAFDYKWARHNFRAWAINKKAFSNTRVNKYIEAMEVPGALTAALNYYRANAKGDFGLGVIKAAMGLKKFKKINVPTLLIWGEKDKALEKGLTSGMQEFFGDYFELKYIPNCSHWVHLEQREKVIELISEFIAKSSSQSSNSAKSSGSFHDLTAAR